jgi:AcrR family transcriptional regulator
LTAGQRRESILVAATEVFAEHGFRRGKVSAVAARIGVSEPVVFQNFGTKAALFAAVLDRAATAACAVLAAAIEHGTPASQWLAATLSPGHVEQFHAPGSPGALFAEAAGLTGDPDVGEEARRTIQRIGTALASLVAHGQQVGDVRADVDADAVAWWIMSLLSARAFRTAVAPDPAAVEAQLAAMTSRLIAN